MGVSSFTFNGVSSTNYAIKVEKHPDYPVAERVVEHVHVDGHNGDYLLDTGAYNNVPMVYSIYYHPNGGLDFWDGTRNIAFWLNGSKGYCRLEDTYDPQMFRMAVMSNYTEYKNWMDEFGRVDVEFSCKPQRFFKTGEQQYTYSSGGRIPNDWMPCYPILVVTGNGSVNIDGNVITVTNNANKTIYIDTEIQDAYSGTYADGGIQIWDGRYNIGDTYDVVGFEVTKFNPNDYDTIFLSYHERITYPVSGSQSSPSPSENNYEYTIDPSQTFSVIHQGGGSRGYRIDKLENFNTISFEMTGSGVGPYYEFSNIVVKTFSNRNDDISINGEFPCVPTGGSDLTYTVDSLKVIPRWWTL